MFLLHILVFKEFAELFEGLHLLMLCDAHIVVMFVMTISKKCPFLLVLTSEFSSYEEILQVIKLLLLLLSKSAKLTRSGKNISNTSQIKSRYQDW